MRGSQNNDAFVPQGRRRIGTETNRHGGMLGGICSGEPIVCRVAVKPTSSLPRPQRTVTRAGEPTEIVTKGRHDPCLLPRFVPMGEAMVALVLVDHWLRQQASRVTLSRVRTRFISVRLPSEMQWLKSFEVPAR